MSIEVGDDIGLEMHPDVDQFIRVEQGEGIIVMGIVRIIRNFKRRVREDYVILSLRVNGIT